MKAAAIETMERTAKDLRMVHKKGTGLDQDAISECLRTEKRHRIIE
jgi:hypothetical protein